MKYTYLFGPVPSRRLGLSLGVDLVPHKVCSLNCVYCECGKTTRLTAMRKEYVPTAAVIRELDRYLSTAPALDYITFSGAGEPTLHSGLGKILAYIKERFPRYKVALLTNGTLFGDKQLRQEILPADVISPSLDAVSAAVFKRINRPCSALKVSTMIAGLVRLRKEFKGKLWLEVFIVPGINDMPRELGALKKAIQKIQPDKIQLNTLDRPGTEKWVGPVSAAKLAAIRKYLGRKTEIIGPYAAKQKNEHECHDAEAKILGMIRRRPCTARDLAHTTGFSLRIIDKHIHWLIDQKKVTAQQLKRGTFYRTLKGS